MKIDACNKTYKMRLVEQNNALLMLQNAISCEVTIPTFKPRRSTQREAL